MLLLTTFFNKLRKLQAALRGSDVDVVVGLLGVLVLSGTIGYSILEDWTILEALYATIITITTVGYGDLSPTSDEGRIFAMGFTLVAIGIGGYALSSLAVIVIEQQANKLTRKLRGKRMKTVEDLTDHYIICGLGTVGRSVIREFKLSNTPFVVVETDEEKLRTAMRYLWPGYFEKLIDSVHNIKAAVEIDLPESLEELAAGAGILFLQEDPTIDPVLAQAGIDRAKGLVATMDDDRDNLSIIIGARALANRMDNEDLKIISRVHDERYFQKFYLAGANFVRSPAHIAGSEIAQHIASPSLGGWWYGMLLRSTDRFGDAAVKPAWLNRAIQDIQADYNHSFIVTAIKRGEDYLSLPTPNTRLQDGDILIYLGTMP